MFSLFTIQLTKIKKIHCFNYSRFDNNMLASHVIKNSKLPSAKI